MFKRMIVMLLSVGIIFGGIFGYHAFQAAQKQKIATSARMPAIVVSTVKAQAIPWQPQVMAVGSIKTVRGVAVTGEVPGIVREVKFKSGDVVKEGQELVRLNTDTDRAQLRSLKILAELAHTVYKRDKKQFAVQAVSQATLDADIADLKNKRVLVAQQEAAIAKKIIRAPFAGRLGISAVNPGQYLNPGDNIVPLQSLDPIYFDFYLPQQELPKIAIGQNVDLATDAYPGRAFNGKITAIDPQVNAESRNVLVEATIPNPKHELLPGMYASVEVKAGATTSYLTLPQAAVAFNPYGETVYVVAEKGKGPDGKPILIAQQQFVVTGETRGDQVAILQGITEGDVVVTSGQLKLRNGSEVSINNQVQPANDPDPKPVDL